jgi:hypothetical protein
MWNAEPALSSPPLHHSGNSVSKVHDARRRWNHGTATVVFSPAELKLHTSGKNTVERSSPSQKSHSSGKATL